MPARAPSIVSRRHKRADDGLDEGRELGRKIGADGCSKLNGEGWNRTEELAERSGRPATSALESEVCPRRRFGARNAQLMCPLFLQEFVP
jgi:hypothetical protein